MKARHARRVSQEWAPKLPGNECEMARKRARNEPLIPKGAQNRQTNGLKKALKEAKNELEENPQMGTKKLANIYPKISPKMSPL